MVSKIIRITIWAIIGLVICIEVLLRIFYYEQLKTQHYPLIYQLDSIIGYSHISNCKSKICIPSINKSFKLNNHGNYGHDFTVRKSDSAFRIAFVGNSVTEGIWLNGNENYPMMLQKLFDDNGYKNIEVINCSYGGVDKDIRNYKLIKKQIIHYNADLVLFNFNFPFYNENEFRENYKNYVLRHSGTSVSRQKAINHITDVEKKVLFKILYDVSYIYRVYCKKF